jgi:alcohol dehydrogenase class IV
LAHKFIKAVRDLRTEVGIPDQMDAIKRADFDAIVRLAIQEGASYPVPRLLDAESTMVILNNIAARTA